MPTFSRVYHTQIGTKQNTNYEFHQFEATIHQILDSIVVSIPACHAGDRGSIPRRGDFLIFFLSLNPDIC